MRSVGIEMMNAFGGISYLDVMELAEHRKLDTKRFSNLLMKEKTVSLPYEDPVTFGVNAAMPIIKRMSEEEKNRIELLITCTESGIDFGKAISTYIHKMLDLNSNCRVFEIKNACYSGVAGLQMAINFILANVSPGAKALVIASDLARFMKREKKQNVEIDGSYAEPSSGAGAVAMLVSDNPKVFQIDVGANGYYGFEVCDTCRPIPDSEVGDADLSLLSYLDCCEGAFSEYKKRVPEADYKDTFSYIAYHTPFGGMVKGAHRNMMRKMKQMRPAEIEVDFQQRVIPGMKYSQRVGNIMGANAMLALLSVIDNADFEQEKRIGCFSYGSGCCSEFYSGIADKHSQEIIRSFGVQQQLDSRYKLSIDEYEDLLYESNVIKFGVKDIKLNHNMNPAIFNKCREGNYLVLDEIKNFHRSYIWAGV